MLLRFRVANHRSIRAVNEISFVATEYNEGTARETGVRSDGRDLTVVPVAGVFGANASGKSNVLDALRTMRDAVRLSLAEWAQGAGVPREPFALDESGGDDTTMFEVDLLLGDPRIRYTYGFELSDQRIEAEWLHAYPHGRKQVWFDRDADRAQGDFVFPGDGLKGGKDRLADFTRPNSLFLTVAASLNHPQLTSIYRWFLDNLELLSPRTDAVTRSGHTRRLLTDPRALPRHREQIEALLRVADLGVAGVEIDPSLPPDRQVRLLHHTSVGQPFPLDFVREESLGTFAWFSFLGPLLSALDHGSLLLVDELDASLHPMLAGEVIRLFQDEDANPHGAQLLFTTHDATFLGTSMVERPLDRDQVWITAKQRSGETELYPLIDARPRKEENLERGYLRGRYGGIPRITTGDLAREVVHTLAKAG